MKKIFVLLIFALFLQQDSFADIYMFEDNSGVFHFTDTPQHDRYKLIIKTPQTQRDKFSNHRVLSESKIYSANEIHDNIISISKKNLIDPDLVLAVIEAESGFDTNAISKKGAIGLMQLMPKTANILMVDNPYDPIQNIDGGVRYLKNLHKLYSGNLDYTLAAYNAGETAVYQYKGVPPYKETINYIERVKRYYRLIKSRGVSDIIDKIQSKNRY